MKNLVFILLAMLLFSVGCSKDTTNPVSSLIPFPTGAAAYAPVVSGNNVLPLEVSSGYVNEPVVTVQVCNPGSTTNCVTITNVLLDTGSSGLRVFGSLLSSLSLTQVFASNGGDLAKCTYYGDGTTQWGPVKTANVILGGETVSNVNIQILDANYKTIPTACGTPDSSPSASQYNGILGIGTRDQDCGLACLTSATGNLYFTCSTSGTTCSTTTAALNLQVRNPVAAMTTASNSDAIDDSNGTILVLPTVSSTGAQSASGYVIFGVGNRPNNTPDGSIVSFRTDANGNFYTDFNGTSNINAFIDSGSNALYFPATSQTPTCSGGWFCPTSTVTLQATQKDSTRSVSKVVSFEIINAQQISKSANQVYSGLGGDESGTFDWGLPFFFGRSVYTGIYGKSSVLNANGTYSYYAY
ncbi:MAG: DUF3443 family protein [Pseudobdellovibrionaceae bacterium]